MILKNEIETTSSSIDFSICILQETMSLSIFYFLLFTFCSRSELFSFRTFALMQKYQKIKAVQAKPKMG
jgi:hypothetical protein